MAQNGEGGRVGSQSAHDAFAGLPNFEMHGDEVVAMLLYPEFTALDLVAPHYFFACMMGATVHLVAKQKDKPIASDLGLAIMPTMSSVREGRRERSTPCWMTRRWTSSRIADPARPS
jgi:hypothetical protein